jgi:hypothetical protein
MWPIFEFTHDLFKSDAVDFLDGGSYVAVYLHSLMEMLVCRNTPLAGQLHVVWY